MKILRQGDVLIKKITTLPKNLKKVEGSVLAHGESGHKHQIQVAEKQDFQLYQDAEGKFYFETQRELPLVHEEHGKIDVSPGFYVVEREREYSYVDEAIKRVID
jgi:hypothetical protein